MAYSVDYRRRVLEYLKEGHTQAEAQGAFSVGTTTIKASGQNAYYKTSAIAPQHNYRQKLENRYGFWLFILSEKAVIPILEGLLNVWRRIAARSSLSYSSLPDEWYTSMSKGYEVERAELQERSEFLATEIDKADETYDKIVQLKMRATDGKMRITDVADVK